MKFHLLYSPQSHKLQIVETGVTLSGDGWKHYTAVFSADKIGQVELVAAFLYGLISGMRAMPSTQDVQKHIEGFLNEEWINNHLDSDTIWGLILSSAKTL